MPATLARACGNDITEIEDILRGAMLPLEGLRSQFPSAFIVARHAGAIVGVAALERYGTAGLLRSVAVVSSLQKHGIGRLLVVDRLEQATQAGLAAVFLLTTTAREYFEQFGFRPAARGRVPASMAESPEFAGVCPSSAACLVWSPPR